jgi:tight adherence protein B
MAFVCILFGIFYALQINIMDFVQVLTQPLTKKVNLKDRILYAQGRKKKNYIYLLIEDTGNILKLNGKEQAFPRICALSVISAFIGVMFGLTLNNYFIAPVLGFGMCMIPFLYVKFLGIRLKKQQNEELETALSIITSSYIRSEDIVTAMEENKEYINPPVKQVFEQFTLEANLLSPDIKKLISGMKEKIDNTVFKEWCDAIMSCQEDSSLKSTLFPIVKKLSNIRLVSVRLDALLYAPVKEYISLVLLLALNIPLMYFLNRTWFEILLYSIPGKLVLTLCAAVIFISALQVVKISRPIEYKR